MNNWKSNYKYRKYQSFILNDKIVPTPETFQARSGRTYTRLVFNVPSFPTFSVLDFDYNSQLHLIKLCENSFNEMLLNAINNYIMNTKDTDPWFKPVKEEVPTGQSVKDQRFDNLFNDTPSAPQQPEAPQQQQEEASDDSIWN